MTPDKNIILIDGHSLAYRTFYALPRLETSSGHPTGATYGFYSMLWRMIDDQKPYTMVVAFDAAEKTFRHAIRKEYKAQRKPTPDELRPQFQDMKDLIHLLGFEWYQESGYEGDDIIGSLCHSAARVGAVSIVSSDLDMMQLVDHNTVLLRPFKGITSMKRLDREIIQQEMGIAPGQVVDLIAMAGDPSDNIPGIPGVGEKTAARFLQAYGSWEGVLENLDSLPPRFRQIILDHREKVEESRRLATILTDLPLKADFQPWSPNCIHWDALIEKLESLQFFKAKKRLDAMRPEKTKTVSRQGSSLRSEQPERGEEILIWWNEQLLSLTDRDRQWAAEGLQPAEETIKKKKFIFFPLPASQPALLQWIHQNSDDFVNAETALFLTHPFLIPELNQMKLKNAAGIDLWNRLIPFFALSHQWINRSPALFSVYRTVEVPLLRSFLQKDDKSLYASQDPFPEIDHMSDLPLFQIQPRLALIEVPEEIVPAFLRIKGDDGQIRQKWRGWTAIQTFYGLRFLISSQEQSGESGDRLQKETIRIEINRILGSFLYQAGCHQIYSSPKGVHFSCRNDSDEAIIDQVSRILDEHSFNGSRLQLKKPEKGRYSVAIQSGELIDDRI